MSLNRENVVWETESGRWRCGHFDFYEVGDPFSEDFDPEWDVEYTDDFRWVSDEHDNAADAYEAYPGPNPGGTTIVPRELDLDACRRYDAMAKALEEAWRE